MYSQYLPDFTVVTPDYLQSVYEKQKGLVMEINDRIAGLDLSTLTYADCFEYEIQTLTLHSTTFCLLYFDQLHSDNKIRDKSAELKKESANFMITQAMRQDVWGVIAHYYSNQYQEEKLNLTQEQVAYVEKVMVRIYGIEDKVKQRVGEINKQLATYASDYNKNFYEITTILEFDREELDGMDESWIDARCDHYNNLYMII